MKIAIATSVYAPQINGVAVFSHNLAEGLSARGHEVAVLTPSQKKRSKQAKQAELAKSQKFDITGKKNGTLVYFLKSRELKFYPDQIHEAHRKGLFYEHGFKASIKPYKQMSKILDEFKPDIIHVQGSDPVGLAAVKYAHKHKIPVVLTEHNQPEVLTEPIRVPKLLRGGINRMLSSYFVSREKRVDYVTMPTQKSIDILLKDRNLNVPVEPVSNGVDLKNFKPGQMSKHEKPTVLYIGRIDPEKKVGTVIEAFNKIDECLNARLLIVGDGVDKERLEKMYKSPNIKFLGRVTPPELYNIYRMGDVFATASEIETQGIVLIEAAATGLPLIAVDAGAVKEVCQDGINGRLIKPGDVDGMARAMEEILMDDKKRAQMSKKSLEIAEAHSLDKTLDKFEQIYQKLTK